MPGKDRQRDGAIVGSDARRRSGSLSTPRPTPKVRFLSQYYPASVKS